jgi:tRNA(Ile)-lysidine synthase
VSFTPGRLRAALAAVLPGGEPPRGLCVALSGGLDSTVLLAALASLRDTAGLPALRAVHVDHALHADSARWSEHCAGLAAGLGVPCELARVAVAAVPGESLEAAARAARYGALAGRLRAGEALLTAHHADDQLEGILLQWLRGGGLRALAGMRTAAPFAGGWHLRPLLSFTREELRAWALHRGLEWLEDPSNADPRFDRNYLRLEVLPALQRRWPAAARTVARVAQQATEALELDAAAAAADLAPVARGQALAVAALAGLEPARQRRVLREWLRARRLPPPSAATLEALRRDMLAAAPDRVPATRWPGAEVRRWRGYLYAEPPEPAAAWSAGAWDPASPFDLGASGRLELREARGAGLSRTRLVAPLQVVPRPVGAVFRPAGSPHRRDLRRWLQQRDVLPWRRATLPVVMCGSEIAAVADLACDARFAAAPGEDAWQVVWADRPLLTSQEAVAPARED